MGSSNPNLPTGQCLPETLLGWRGYSLIAPRPGQHLSADGSDTLEPETYNVPTGAFPLQVAYAPTPGTLPVLRFGHTYRVRARAVDLAGNSIPFSTDTSSSAFTYTCPGPSAGPAFYGRLEPLAAPVLVPTAPRTPGEDVLTLVIRSNYDIPDTDPSILPTIRWVAPPVTSVQLAEAHGALDDASGVPQANLYPTLAAMDGQTFGTPSVMAAQGGVNDNQPLNAGNPWIYYPGNALNPPYLPDVIARGAVFQNLPGSSPGPMGVSFGGTPWPQSQLFTFKVVPGNNAPVPPTSLNNFTLLISAPKASITTVLMSSYFSSTDLGVMTLWSWLIGSGLANPTLESQVLSGEHWMFTPYRELTIVHAVQQPLIAPMIPGLSASRSVGLTFAELSVTMTFDAQSTQRVDIVAQWTEPFDDGKNPKGAVELSAYGRVGEYTIDLGASDTASDIPMRHEFGDTKHRFVYYQAVANSRFLEYFAQYSTVTMIGTAPVTLSTTGLAVGATVVTDPTTSAAYVEGADYEEDDIKGTISRIASGSIPNGAPVDVQYVVPPVTRSSLEPAASPPTPLGVPVTIPSSARPQPPEVLFVLPAFEWKTKATVSNITSSRGGNTLRVYLGRPWWSSGEDEQLGVVVAQPLTSLPAALTPLVTTYGQDPLFPSATGSVISNPSLSNFTKASDTNTGVLLAEQSDQTPWVGVAGHVVNWDKTHQLWYADITIDAGTAYWPFVGLGLVRFQPSSLSGVEVSPVVQADVTQLAPDRMATLTFPGATSVSLTVAGASFTSSSVGPGPSLMTAFVQTAQAGVTDPELMWTPQGSATTLTPTTNGLITTWTGTLTLPASRGSQPLRIVITEAEQYPVVGAGDAAERVTYFDAIVI